ncbi:hypothetical protein [Dysgonomonas sp. BGC7]|uniref:hypothetical protein n=1 Tax=Dysgonomonas sp. BGC7 TaxID=1658008 RepID=UPI00068366B9|nr:hypothetical protein [Dysgonomonas sp. BGC7]MBD8389640.1 hypothetical protein [Dysgonomonas sp. BGC7]
MIDLITLVKPSLSDEEIFNIVWRNGLQTNSKDGVVFYDNIGTKNLKQQNGLFIRIETNGRLKLEGSLHKYRNDITNNGRNNFDLFTMSEAKGTIERLLFDKGIVAEGTRVYNYEVGINLNVSKDCRAYMDKMRSIGPEGNLKPFFVNARYKDKRTITTLFHKDFRKYFKVYDKVFEMKDRKSKLIPEGNILRIETVFRRQDKCFVNDFFSPDNLRKMVNTFFRDWRTIQFEKDIITPKGTGRARQQLCIEIMNKGPDIVLRQAKEKHDRRVLTDWEYRNIREFVTNEWNVLKKEIRYIKSDEELEFRQLMADCQTIIENDDYSTK